MRRCPGSGGGGRSDRTVSLVWRPESGAEKQVLGAVRAGPESEVRGPKSQGRGLGAGKKGLAIDDC